jgi:ABC-2 type transport system permease protein/sodium transport system permease protein
VRLEGVLQVVPLLNIVLLTRDILKPPPTDIFTAATTVGTTVGTTLIVVFSTVVYAVAAIALAARIFGAEAVLYSEQATWGDLFRRAKKPQPALTLPAALFAVAAMFPVGFVVLMILARMDRTDYTLGLILNLAGNLVLFVLVPFLFVWMGRVRLREGLRLERWSVWGWPGAVLLGMSLWALIYLLHELLRELQMSTQFGTYSVTAMSRVLRQWREHSPIPLIASRAIVPAVLEELFFRGLLLGAFLRVMKPTRAIVASSVVFGVFHLVEGSFERCLATTMLGMILGWVAWWTGSVLPGMIAHALHNSLLLLLAYYQQQLVLSGWIRQGPVIPASWTHGAVGLFVLGMALIWLLGRNRIDPQRATG